MARLRREVASLRQEKQVVESQGSDNDKQLGQARLRISQLEQQLGEREGEIRSQGETIRQHQETKERLVREGEGKQKVVDKRENTIKKLSGEILKANEIIGKLQEGVRQEQGKTKLRGHIAQVSGCVIFLGVKL